MIEIKYCPSDYETNDRENEKKAPSAPGKDQEIILPPPDNATNVIPDEVPRRDGPGGN